jgi:hypothetical protein
VELEPADDAEVTSEATLGAATRNLVDWFARLETLLDVLRRGHADAADLAPRVSAHLALICMLCGGTVEAHRRGHPVWTEITGTRREPDEWALTLNADGVLWPSLYVSDEALMVIVRRLSASPPVVFGKEVRAFGLPENVESAESFTLSFPRT